MAEDEFDVLIVGGGPAGLCSSIALSRRGVRSLLVEKHAGTAPLPKALHLSSRTMEVLHGWEVDDMLRPLALPLGDHALFAGSSLADPDHVRHPIWPDNPDVSRQRSVLISQEILEPALLAAAEKIRPGELRFSTRLTDLREDDGPWEPGVVARVEGPDGTRTVRAKWVIGADGADSTVRRVAGIDFPGKDVHRSVNILFRADLRTLVSDRRSAFYHVHNDIVHTLLAVVDNEWFWRLHVVLGDGETYADYADERRQLELVRAAVGVPGLEVELHSCYPWTGSARVASRYRSGRLLLAGDAAHVNPPSGGLGMNAGIQDVHNLVWKLVAVVRGQADEGLLDTYEQERRPTAVRTVAEAVRNHEYEEAPALTERDRRRKHARRRQDGLVLGHHYTEGAFVPDGSAAPEVAEPYSDFVPVGRPGHRAPHLWVTWQGRRTSLLDVFAEDRCTLLVAGPRSDPWADVLPPATQLITVGIGAAAVPEQEAEFREIYGLSPGGAVLVRPDGIVALRMRHRPDTTGARASLADAVEAMHLSETG
ncbi:FAD-dependent monooxygenase [Streptomyces spongiae]|uniref:FAD-binding protein n=1 Tax=Streptomyces spongiae TaxID=565072 RepID=A0A5N8X9R4_9ACTN|nr:FAD-dependent monooxygenase [Streptomyces spongiae]MPY56182.1 FAD-binding protein [Streptomyces spongiae]